MHEGHGIGPTFYFVDCPVLPLVEIFSVSGYASLDHAGWLVWVAGCTVLDWTWLAAGCTGSGLDVVLPVYIL